MFVLSPRTALQLTEEDEISSAGPGSSLSLRVPDLPRALALVDALGLPHSDVATLGETAGMFTLQDPDGRDVTILQVAT